MIVRLFDVQNGKAVPAESCYTLASLKAVMEAFPDTYMSVYQYVFYMTCPNPDLNPFFNLPEHEKEDMIIEEVPDKLLAFIQSHVDTQVGFLIALNGFLLIVGSFSGLTLRLKNRKF